MPPTGGMIGRKAPFDLFADGVFSPRPLTVVGCPWQEGEEEVTEDLFDGRETA
jgi:hypothetical protein